LLPRSSAVAAMSRPKPEEQPVMSQVFMRSTLGTPALVLKRRFPGTSQA
jgi:hypothetical protein